MAEHECAERLRSIGGNMRTETEVTPAGDGDAPEGVNAYVCRHRMVWWIWPAGRPTEAGVP